MKGLFKTVFLFILIMSLTLVGCSKKEETKEPEETAPGIEETTKAEEPMDIGEVDEPVDINFQIAWDVASGRGKNIEIAINEFMVEYPNIKVTMITGGNEQQTVTSLLNDAAPEVIQLGVKTVKTIAAEGLLLDLSSMEAEYKAIFSFRKIAAAARSPVFGGTNFLLPGVDIGRRHHYAALQQFVHCTKYEFTSQLRGTNKCNRKFLNLSMFCLVLNQ